MFVSSFPKIWRCYENTLEGELTAQLRYVRLEAGYMFESKFTFNSVQLTLKRILGNSFIVLADLDLIAHRPLALGNYIGQY